MDMVRALEILKKHNKTIKVKKSFEGQFSDTYLYMFILDDDNPVQSAALVDASDNEVFYVNGPSVNIFASSLREVH